MELLQSGQTLISEIFGEKFGNLKKGSAADLVILDYQAPTPMTSRNALGHLLFGMNASSVESVIIRGRWVVRNRVLVGLDVDGILRRAELVAAKLWKRMASIDR
jgi:cytosine/adenosine deaminase-related metal-dependent hydrolase